MEFIQNNYLRGLGNGPTWHVEIDPPSRPIKNYYEEAKIAAEMIWAQKQGKLYITYSGGLDSEFVLSIFHSMKMEIQPVIMKLSDYNQHDIKYAFDFCQAKNITPIVIDLDFDKFVKSGEMLSIAESAKCAAFELPASMWLVKQLDGTVLTGNDPPHLKLNQTDNQWYLDEEEIIHSQFNFWRDNKIFGTPFFLSYTPELMLSFLQDPTIVSLANGEFEGKLGTNSSKVHTFNRGNDFNLVQRVKQTGYEVIYRSEILNHPDMQKVLSWRNIWLGTSDHLYSDVVQKLSNGEMSVAYSSAQLNSK